MKDIRSLLDTMNPQTFDAELLIELRYNHALIRDYLLRDREIFETYDNYYGSGRPLFRPGNPHGPPFHALLESLISVIETKVIRGFHYTRITDAEVDIMRTKGIRISTRRFLKRVSPLLSQRAF